MTNGKLATLRYIKRTRNVLSHALGDKCAKCGTTEDLEFDVVEPALPEQFLKGNLQLLCTKHNSAKEDDHKCPLLL